MIQTLRLDKGDVELSLNGCVIAGHNTATGQLWLVQCAGFDVQ